MPQFEKSPEEGIKKEVSRREFLKMLGIAAASLHLYRKESAAQEASMPSRYEKGWFYTLEEMQKIYEQEYNSEQKLLRNIIKKRGNEWIGQSGGKEFIIPQSFIDQTLTHFKEMLEKNTARFLFRLDASHGHFFIHDSIFERSYASLKSYETVSLLVSDKNLGVLFHNSEHLKVEEGDKDAQELYLRRNVLGWYDGRPLEILPLPTETKSTAASSPQGTHNVGPLLSFAAHKDGELAITVGNKEIRLDISLNDENYW